MLRAVPPSGSLRAAVAAGSAGRTGETDVRHGIAGLLLLALTACASIDDRTHAAPETSAADRTAHEPPPEVLVPPVSATDAAAPAVAPARTRPAATVPSPAAGDPQPQPAPVDRTALLQAATDRLAECRRTTAADATERAYYAQIKVEMPDSPNRDALLRSKKKLTRGQKQIVGEVLARRKVCREAYLRDLTALPGLADVVAQGVERSDLVYSRLLRGQTTIGAFNIALERIDAETRTAWDRVIEAMPR